MNGSKNINHQIEGVEKIDELNKNIKDLMMYL